LISDTVELLKLYRRRHHLRC